MFLSVFLYHWHCEFMESQSFPHCKRSFLLCVIRKYITLFLYTIFFRMFNCFLVHDKWNIRRFLFENSSKDKSCYVFLLYFFPFLLLHIWICADGLVFGKLLFIKMVLQLELFEREKNQTIKQTNQQIHARHTRKKTITKHMCVEVCEREKCGLIYGINFLFVSPKICANE